LNNSISQEYPQSNDAEKKEMEAHGGKRPMEKNKKKKEKEKNLLIHVKNNINEMK
jgi:hypothetical protein